MQPVRIPRRCDDPIHLLLWSLDEMLPLLLGLTIGVLLGKALICSVIGMAMTNLYRRFQDLHPRGYLNHLLYWYGFMSFKAKSMKNPFVKRYLP